jgi:hypothetical protein
MEGLDQQKAGLSSRNYGRRVFAVNSIGVNLFKLHMFTMALHHSHIGRYSIADLCITGLDKSSRQPDTI